MAMRRGQLPLRPKTDEARMRIPKRPAEPTRKIFNCIVDDTALIAGVKKTTRDGIRKWVSQGAVRLFVPLHTLSQLDRLKKGTDHINADVQEAIKWLDVITSVPDAQVILEGAEEIYNTWEEVEKHLLPETIFSMEDSESDEDGYNDELESSFNATLDVSDETSMSSSHSFDETPKSPRSVKSSFSCGSVNLGETPCYNPKAEVLLMDSPDRTARNSAEIARPEKSPQGSVPVYLRPLFNHIMWRINKEFDPTAALGNFILLTNDPVKHNIAQKFGIRPKRLEQLRDAVGREDREYKNRLVLHKMETQISNKTEDKQGGEEQPEPGNDKEVDSDSDEILFKRAPRGPQAQNLNNHRVWDPNEFGRTNQHYGGRGGRGSFGGPRGRAVHRGGRGSFAPRGNYVASAPSIRTPATSRIDPNQPIDPDSFARTSLRANTMRGQRGQRRKLWEPN